MRDRSRASRELERQATLVEGNLCDPASIAAAMAGVSVVFHCAAATRNNLSWSVHEETNVVGTQVVLAEALKAGVRRVVHVSSIVVYGLDEPRDGAVIDESEPYASIRDPWAHYLPHTTTSAGANPPSLRKLGGRCYCWRGALKPPLSAPNPLSYDAVSRTAAVKSGLCLGSTWLRCPLERLVHLGASDADWAVVAEEVAEVV